MREKDAPPPETNVRNADSLNESAFEAARKAYHQTHVGDYGTLRAAISAYLNAHSNETTVIDGNMTDAEVNQWIEACNHEPAKAALRDYLNLRSVKRLSDEEDRKVWG